MAFNVPNLFKPKMPVKYPPHQNGPMIEDYCEDYFRTHPVKGWMYLPIKWTAYHIKHGYGKDVMSLRSFVKSLPDRKFFTVVQYDDGTLCDDLLPGCRIFGAGGVGTDPVPLLCTEHPVQDVKRDLLFSFVGSMGTHPLRNKLRQFFDIPNAYIGSGDTELFRRITARSKFALCPRGYGKTSFRLYETMQMGAIPVYISDEFWLPWQGKVDWNQFSIRVPPEMISGIPETLFENSRWDCDPAAWYKRWFTMERTCELITEALNDS